MTQERSLKTIGVALTFAAIVGAGMMNSSRLVRAQDDQGGGEGDEARIHRGLAIAPVHLNLEDKDRDLAGLGSYWVNAVSDCNGCHSAGTATEFTPTGNPFLLSPPFTGKQKINPATYLGGGRDFGPFPGPPFPSIPHLYSKNLTPDKSGLPVGGWRFEQFRDAMRHGTDFDHLHPNCTAGPGTPPNCLVAPFNGDLLQVMPWPAFQNMTDHDLRAIYEYLKAVPCNPGPGIEGAPYLQNTCD